MSITPIITFKNVVKKYKNCTITYPDFIIDHRVTLLVGKNGSGKSTLLKAILGLIHYEGEIELTKRCSYMPEKTQFPLDVTLREFLEQVNPDTTDQISQYLSTFHLLEKQNELLKNLSKGMKGKVNLIQAILQPTEVLILDEPVDGLDHDALHNLVDYIQETSRYVLITTHQFEAFSSLQAEVIEFD